jgi:hypothetical protein
VGETPPWDVGRSRPDFVDLADSGVFEGEITWRGLLVGESGVPLDKSRARTS